MFELCGALIHKVSIYPKTRPKSSLRGRLRGHVLKGPPQGLVLGGVVGPADAVGGGQQDGLVDLLVAALLDVDGVAVAALVGEEQGDGAGDGGGGLDVDAHGGEGLLQPRQDGRVGPGRGDGVEADVGQAGRGEDGVQAAGEAEDGVFGGGCFFFFFGYCCY